MKFTEHLRQFFGEEVAEAELADLAVHAIATDVRRLKPAISQAVWDARQQSTLGEQSGATSRLDDARQLREMYDSAIEEFRQITELPTPAEAVAGHNDSSESIGRTEDDSDSTREHS